MSAPDVSVIIPCYNRQSTVRAAVQSVLDQDYGSFEVIAVDDSSTDETLAELNAIEDPRLQVIARSGPRGQCRTSNHGIAHARGRWIAFQDSDDLWLPGKLSAQMARLNSGDWIAAYCGLNTVIGTAPDAPVVETHPAADISPKEGDIMPSLRYGVFSSTQTLIIARDVLDAVGGWDPEFAALNDWDLMLRVAPLGKVAFVDDILVLQRISPDSVSRSDPKRLAANLQILNKHRDVLAEDPGALAHHFYRMAGMYRHMGDVAQAAAYARKALKLAPLKPRYMAMALYNTLFSIGGRRPVSE